MIGKPKKGAPKPLRITHTRVREIVATHLAQIMKEQLRSMKIKDLVRTSIEQIVEQPYGVDLEKCWTVYLSPDRLPCISKETGKVVYDEVRNQERDRSMIIRNAECRYGGRKK